MKNTSKAYLAGVIDSDGCIGLRKVGKRKYYSQLNIRVASKWKSFALHLWELSGRKGKVTAYGNRGINGITMYRWRTSNIGARDLLQEILPYLNLKRKEAELSLSMKFKLGRWLTESDVRERNKIGLKVGRLKKSKRRGGI